MRPEPLRIVASALICTSLVSSVRAEHKPTSDRPVDNFSLRDFRGAERSLDDWRDKPLVVIAFLGVECPLAKLYAPRLEALAKQYADKGVAVVVIDSNLQDSMTELAAFAREHGLTLPLLKDADQVVADELGAQRTPEVFLLDSKRRVRYRGRIDDQYGFDKDGRHYQRAAPQESELAAAMDSLLAGRDVPTRETKAVGCLIGRRRTPQADAKVTYAKDIAPLMQAHCVECHRPGQIAPFPLTNYDETIGWAEMIREVTAERRMPPWHADPAVGHFKNDQRLSDDQLALIDRWVDEGAAPGNLAEVPLLPDYAEGWTIPEPQQVLYMSEEPFDVPAEGTVEYQHFVVDPGWTEDKWISDIEPRPGNPKVVHHILVFVKKPKKGKPTRAGQLSNEFIGAYAPGFRQIPLAPGMARFVPAGSKLMFQMHYTPNGTPQQDRSMLGLRFAGASSVKKEVVVQSAANYTFEIPPGAANHAVEGTYTFRRDSLLLALMPHMHVRGKNFRYVAQYPDGREEVLLDVPRYDFGWQTDYYLAEPKPMPKGTKLISQAHFDNSPDNPNNPDPGAEVRFGEQTWEEMMIGFFQMALADQDLTQPEVESLERVQEFTALYQINGLKFSQDLRKSAHLALDDASDEGFSYFAQFVGSEVMPQVDRICITYVDGEKLRLWQMEERAEFNGVPRSKSTVLKAAGQALAEYALGSQAVVVRDLTTQPGSIMRQMAGKGARSSLHVPFEAHGRRATLNLWSLDANAFPPEAIKVAEALVAELLKGEGESAAK